MMALDRQVEIGNLPIGKPTVTPSNVGAVRDPTNEWRVLLNDVLPMMQLGWSDADPLGPNGGETAHFGLRRVPLGEVLLGFGERASRAELTRESAKQRAILWLPSDAGSPAALLVHFHGHNLGWRHDVRASRGGPRDLHRDRIGAQLAACGRCVAAVLPQGGLRSEFAPGPFDVEAFLAALRTEVVLELDGALGASATPVVVSAHSGGGAVLASMLSGRTSACLPAGTRAVVLLDAINGPNELLVIQKWAERLIDATATTLASASNDVERFGILASSMRLVVRTTFGNYRKRAASLRKAIERRLGPYADALPPSLGGLWRDRFRFESALTGVDHDHLVGAGDPLSAVLTAVA